MGAHTSAHLEHIWSTYEPTYEFGSTYQFGSTCERTYTCLYVCFFPPGSYMVLEVPIDTFIELSVGGDLQFEDDLIVQDFEGC